MILKQLSHILICIMVLKVILRPSDYIKDYQKKSATNIQTKSHQSPVEKWIENEFNLPQNIIREFQSLGVCVTEENIPACISDILTNVKLSNGETSQFLKLLETISPNGALRIHLIAESEKLKKQLSMEEWIRQSGLQTSTTEVQLKQNGIYSLEELEKMYSSAKNDPLKRVSNS